MIEITNYIGGEQVAPHSGAYLDDVDPSTGAVYAKTPDCDDSDIDRAVSVAEEAFPAWSSTPADERCRIMLAIAERLESRLDEFARAECVDNGKPLSLARSLDIPRAVKNIRFFATSVVHVHSESHATDDVAINYTLRQPRGVAGVISPWNLPLYLFTWKIAPALATGNTVVAKPSEITPMTAYLFGTLCAEAGLPPGVLNIVHGLGAKVGSPLTAHPRVPTISFTGGTQTGGAIAETTAPMFKKVSLEMGGKNPNIVFADADLDDAVEGSVRAAFANQGQVCLCGSRLFVQKRIVESFTKRFVDRARQLRVGDPLDAGVDQGAVVSKQHLDKIRYYVNLAKEEGGEVLCGGQSPNHLNDRCRDGFFFEPTVLGGLDATCRVNQEEIFGPVTAIIPFENETEAVELANSTRYGLSASVWTGNVSRAHRVAAKLQSGTVWVNCWLLRDLRVPFGGVKSSGVGREGGLEALRFFTEPKNICVSIPSEKEPA
jgi:aminomuconate-semialdehyde/2-hydroxymuconate-6-semialdehyde dehydrogenase